MTNSDALAVGIVGATGRGRAFRLGIEHTEGARVHAVCDVDEERVAAASEAFGAEEGYTDYDEMLWESDLDAVAIGTPQHLHVSQSVAALDRGLHVLCTVPVGVNVGECRDLLDAARRSPGTYMMAETSVYRRENVLVGALVDAGLFGEVYYAEGDYLHEIKDLAERTRWRRTWAVGRNGNNYPTHELGPVLRWMDDRIERVCCAGSGHHHTDARGDAYEEEDTTVFLGETAKGHLVKIRRDVLSERPHALSNYQLQGTEGCYESARAPGERDRVWLAEYEDAADSGEYAWRDLSEFEEEYLPGVWRDPPAAVAEAGHGGTDYFIAADFVEAIRDGTPSPVDVYEALDMTLPGLVSLESIENDGAWLAVPDPREW